MQGRAGRYGSVVGKVAFSNNYSKKQKKPLTFPGCGCYDVGVNRGAVFMSSFRQGKAAVGRERDCRRSAASCLRSSAGVTEKIRGTVTSICGALLLSSCPCVRTRCLLQLL